MPEGVGETQLLSSMGGWVAVWDEQPVQLSPPHRPGAPAEPMRELPVVTGRLDDDRHG